MPPHRIFPAPAAKNPGQRQFSGLTACPYYKKNRSLTRFSRGGGLHVQDDGYAEL